MVYKKGKGKKAVYEKKIELTIKVPGHVLKRHFEKCTAARKDLLLHIPQGPYSSAQFMSYVCEHRKESDMGVTKMITETSADKLA